MKKAAFVYLSDERKEHFRELFKNFDYELNFLADKNELFDNIFNKNEKYTTIFIPDDIDNTEKIISEIKSNVKSSLNLINYSPEITNEYEADNTITPDINEELLKFTLKCSEKITSLIDTEVKVSDNFYHFEFFKRIIHIEIKRAKRYNIELSLLYLTFNNIKEMQSKSEENFDKLFKEFNGALTTSIRDIDIPIAFGEEAILLLMPHTGKGGANIVAERIYNKLIKMAPEINFSISVVAPEKEELNFAEMMKKIHEGIEESLKKGGKVIIVK